MKLKYKIWFFFRYGVPTFFKNIWRFRTELYGFYPYDWRYPMSMFRRGLEIESKYIEKYGNEVNESRLKKIEKMKRVVQLIKWFENDDFLELAEKDMGYEYITRDFKFEKCEDSEYSEYSTIVDDLTEEEKEKNRILSNRSLELETELFDEFLTILKGQDHKNFKSDVSWESQYNGDGIFGWWD